MYDWLDDALGESSEIITANRRLARELRKEYAQQRMLAGDMVWATPVIHAWNDWIAEFISAQGDQSKLPTILSSHQSRILWERCLRREINDPLLNIGMLARQARDTWSRLQDWRVTVAECQQRACNRDQRMFAAAANSYQSILERESWVDEQGIVKLAIDLINSGNATIPARLTLAGFDRVPPLLQSFLDAYGNTGGRLELVSAASSADSAAQGSLCVPENSDAELRIAGAWARRELEDAPQVRLAIVVTHLEQDAPRSLRLIKEGFVPGWQNAGAAENSTINISYGKKLSGYPAIHTALSLLAWLHRDLSSREVSALLRASVFADVADDARTRIELRLRDLPEQTWSPQLLLTQFTTEEGAGSAGDGLDFVRLLVASRGDLPQRQSPQLWVALFSQLLLDVGWPGADTLSSAEFQTINRWRELLNEIARLALVTETMTVAEVLGRMATIAGETVFQPESGDASVQVMGPLEAAGLEFDALWVTGMNSNNWPPAGRSLTLVSRELQRDYGMPDASPTDTLEYASRVIARLARCARRVTFSYAETQGDAKQSESELLAAPISLSKYDAVDPGWNATRLVGHGVIVADLPDPVPALIPGERIVGGAATIQRQFVEPFSAFAVGRLGVRVLWPMQAGLPANIRGSIIHNALQRLYYECPSRDEIRQWDEAETAARVDKAVQATFRRHEHHADAVQQHLLSLEKTRVKQLLRAVIEVDCERDDFRISKVEEDMELTLGGISMRLRVDRIDSVDDGANQVILDYKTGTPRRLLDREKNPRDMQLIVYACAVGDGVSGIGLFNIDSRSVALDAAGRDLSPKLDWDSALEDWKAQVEIAAQQIAAGDARVSTLQGVKQSRPLGLLSRYRELLHER